MIEKGSRTFSFFAKKAEKRQSIAKKAGYGLTILVFSLFIFSCLTLWSILHLNTTLNNISKSALPAAEGSYTLVNLGKHLLYTTENLASSQTHPSRRIAKKNIDETIDTLKKVVAQQNGFKNSNILKNISGLETTLTELDEFVALRIDVNRRTKKAVSELFSFEERIIDFVSQKSHEIKDPVVATDFSKWVYQTLSFITVASHSSSLNILYKINNAEKRLLDELAELEDISATLPEDLQAEVGVLEAKLGHTVLSKKGLLKLLGEKVKISSQTAARANFTRSLVQEFEGVSTNLFKKVAGDTADDIEQLSKRVNQLIWAFLFFSILGISTTFAVIYYFRRNLTSRLLNLNRAILDKMAGQDVVIEDLGNDEITEMAHSFKYFADEVDARENELFDLAAKDPLTGISNRRFFLEQSEQELARSHRTNEPLTFLMIDLDYFKNINDTYGHHVGDIVLKGFAESTKAMLREVDCFGRIGGEEFAVLLPNTSLEKGSYIAERIRTTTEKLNWQIDQIQINCTVSIGFSASENYQVSLDELMKQADNALYQAKRDGRNLCRNYKEMTQPA